MIADLKTLLKRYPSVYRVSYSWALWIRAILGLPRYVWCRCTRRVYLGPVMLGGLTWTTRVPHMRRLIRDQLATTTDDFNVLEIGSWAGQSAMPWGEELRRSARPGKVFCVDAWRPFASDTQVGLNTAVVFMDSVARKDSIFPLFWHNVKSSGLTDTIVVLRGRSAGILPTLRPQAFDLVFIDASHAYSDFVQDLQLSFRLVKVGGVICGDDLEHQVDEVDRSFAAKERERDFVRDVARGQEYHPGVTLGVADFFGGRVICCDGFWAMRRSADGWAEVNL